MSDKCSYSGCEDDAEFVVKFAGGNRATNCEDCAKEADRDIPGAEIVGPIADVDEEEEVDEDE